MSGELAFQQEMDVAVPRDVAGPAGTGAGRAQGLFDRCQNRRVLAHTEVVVRAPDRHLRADAVISARGNWPQRRSGSANTRYRPSVRNTSSRFLKKPL
jgi:hypothetical protein